MAKIRITYPDTDTAERHMQRIEGSVARTVDIVEQFNNMIVVTTIFPGEFVTSYINDGFEDTLTIQP